MVTIIDFVKRLNAEGQKFFTLLLEGDLEMIQSKETNNWYATAKKAFITSTFNEEACKRLIGSRMPGTIDKVKVDPYEYANPDSGEVITLEHSYRYNPSGQSLEDTVMDKQPDVKLYQD